MRNTIYFAGAVLLVAAVAAPIASGALTPFADNFDNSLPGEPGLVGSAWPNWPTATDHMNASTNHNHTPGGTTSVRLDPEDPFTLANYHDFGGTADSVTASVWVWDDNSATGTAAHPVNYYFGLYGEAGSPTAATDYQLIGLSPSVDNGNTYVVNSKLGGIVTTGLTRTAAIGQQIDPGTNWIQLSIQADPLASGGQVRFYINNSLVGTSVREPSAGLRYLFMGSQSKNYEFFWFDDVNLTPEPSSAAISMVLLLPAFLRRRRSA